MADPNNTKWSKDDSRFGMQMMKKAGWNEGKGLGKEEQGVTSHVKTSRKADNLGIGYDAKVAKTWSQQSVGFEDILKRINTNENNNGEDSEAVASPVGSPTGAGPSSGKHGNAYLKRRRLKTEGLTNGDGKAEILGGKRKRDSDDDEGGEEGGSNNNDMNELTNKSLKSALLARTMIRCTKYEPKPSVDSEDVRTEVLKPVPRPPRCTASPFVT